MTRHWKAAALVALALGAAALTGCSSGGSKEGGMELPKVWGYVTGESVK